MLEGPGLLAISLNPYNDMNNDKIIKKNQVHACANMEWSQGFLGGNM